MIPYPDAPLWWLSFADGKRAKGDTWLGCAIVRAPSFPEACRVAWRMGCNPGGEVQGSKRPDRYGPVPPELDHKLVTDRALLDRVVTAWTGEGIERSS